MNEATGCCRWRKAIGVAAIGFVACSLSAYAAVEPMGNGSGSTPGTDEKSGVMAKSLMQFEHFGTTSPAYLYSQFAEANALRGTGVCTPDLPCTGTPEGESGVLCTVTIGQPAPDDQFNSGCNATTPAFSPISCGETVCGEGFFLTDGGNLARDTDWWIFHVDQQSLMTWSVTSEFIQTIGILTGNDGTCPVTGFFNSAATGACTNGFIQECLAPGTYMLFVAPNFGANTGLTFSCLQYEATLTCAPPCIVACCVGESCVETDSFDCVDVLAGINIGAGSDCTNPAICALGCSTVTPILCDGQVAIDNTTNNVVPNPFFTCAAGSGQIGVLWYEFTATDDSAYVNTCASIPASGGDSTIAVYSGLCNAVDLIEIGCGEDEGCSDANSPWLSETHVTGLTVGNSYFIQFAAWDAAARGQYVLDVVCPSPAFAPGPCCLPNGSCEILSETNCIAASGQYQGPEDPGVFDCDNGDACGAGACCQNTGACSETTQALCEGVIGSTFIPGANCTSDTGFTANPCDGTCCGGAPFFACTNTDENSCLTTWYADEACTTNFWTCPRPRCATINVPANCQSPALESVFGVDVAVPGNIIASSSDSNQVFEDPANPGVLVGTADMDDFIPASTPVSEVCWWGFYSDLSTNAPDGGKCQVNDQFTITFFNDGGDACPVGAPIASETVTSLRATTGDRVTASSNLTYQYNASITPVAVIPGQCYWIAITNNTDPLQTGTQTCRWLWVTAPFAEGNGRSLGTFTNDPTIPQNCADPNNRNVWDYAFCLDVAISPCDFCGGDFCAGGTPEGEPICTNGYVDTFNDGCGASDGTITTNGNFTSVACGDTICATSGNYRSPIPCPNGTVDCPLGETCQTNGNCTGDDGFFRDVDWYAVTVPASDTYEWCVQSEFPYTTGLINTFGQPNCPMGLPWLTLAVGAACEANCEPTTLDAGIYYAVYRPQVFNGIPCGSEYTVSLVCPGVAPCVTTAARSCNLHGATNLCLDILANNIEPRLSGVTSVEIDIDASVATSATVSCVNGGDLSASASVSQAGSTVTVTLAPALPDGDACTITLDCGASVCVRGLAGDVDRNGIVSTGDASIIKPHFGQNATTAGAEFDFDQNDIVSTGDASIVKPRFGNTAVACP